MRLGNWDTVSKTLAIIAFICIIISLLIIVITPSTVSYEISIYNAYPWYFWFFMITTIFLGQLIVLKDVFNKSLEKNNKSWLIGIVVILFPVVILIFIPFIRGYPTYGYGDHLTHIGEVKDILQYGSIAKNNFYPNLHLLTASSVMITGGSVISTVNFVSRLFFFLSPISMYLVFREIFNKKDEIKLALILASSFLFFGFYCMYLSPYNQSFLLLPIVLYLYFKRGTLKNTILFSLLFIIFVISYTFYHPLNLLLLILIFLFLALTFYLYPKLSGVSLIDVPEKILKEKSFNIVLFSILIFFTWYFSFSSIVGSFYKVFSSIFYGMGESIFESQATALATYSPTLFDILKIAIYTYGLLLIIGLLAVFSLLYTFIKWQRNKQSFRLRFCFAFSGIIFLGFSLLELSAFFVNFIVSWNRFLAWSTFFSIILISLTFYLLLSNSKHRIVVIKPIKKIVTTLIVTIALVSITLLSIFTYYPSPANGYVNEQVTYMDWDGMEWIKEHGKKNISIDELGINQWRFYHAIYGVKEYSEINPIGYIPKSPPDHFNYHNKTSLGKYYNESRYMIITYLARIRYPESYPNYKELWRFTPDNFIQLQSDNAVNRLYDNSGFEAYLVIPNNI
jgi:hypothetical protein